MSVPDLSATPGFWEIGSYKTNVRRIKEGIEQIDELSKMAKERAEIEFKYAKALQAFSEKWRGHVDRTVHEGTLKQAWLQLITEGEALSLQHTRVKDRLLDEIVKTLALYRKENHHPSAFRSPKEIREIEEAFEKAQKQWKKLYEKVEAAKKAYHNACRSEKSCLVNLSNAQADTSVSPDALSKMKDRHAKTKEEVGKTRGAYENHLQEIAQYRGPYIENMSFVFEKCQLAELKRSKFVLEMVAGEQTVLADLHRNSKVASVHAKIEQTLKASDENALQADLKGWSSVYGVDAPGNWPAFEEYTPEMRQISASKSGSRDAGGVVLTRQVIKSDDVVPSIPGPASIHSSDNNKAGKDSDSDTNTFDSRRTDNSKKGGKGAGGGGGGAMLKGSGVTAGSAWADGTDSLPATTPDSAKYADFDDENTPNGAMNEHRKGGMATVLYDYTPMEDDEIALTKGQTIELLSEPDSLGWCTGKVGGVSGLFPASYVQSI